MRIACCHVQYCLAEFWDQSFAFVILGSLRFFWRQINSPLQNRITYPCLPSGPLSATQAPYVGRAYKPFGFRCGVCLSRCDVLHQSPLTGGLITCSNSVVCGEICNGCNGVKRCVKHPGLVAGQLLVRAVSPRCRGSVPRC